MGIAKFDGAVGSFARCLHPEDVDYASAVVRRAIAERTDYSHEFRIVRPGGEIRWLCNLGRAEYDDAGQPVRMIGTVQDITDRKLAEETLRESERTLRAVLDATTESIMLLDLNGTVVVANRTMAERVGTTVEEIGGKDARSLLAPDLACSRTARAHEVLRTRRPVQFEDQRAGRYLSNSIMPVFDSNGAIVQFAVFSRDITEQKQAELALRQSERRYQAVLEDQTETICRVKADGTHVFVNDAFCRLFGKTRQELLGAKWQPIALAEDVPQVEEQLRSLSPTNPAVVIENRVYDSLGQVRWMQFVDRGVFDAEGRLVEIQAVGRDITGRKRTEEALREAESRLRLALAASEMGVWEWDMRTNSVFWSPECFPMIGAQAFGGTYEAICQLVHADDVAHFRAAVETAIAQQSTFHVEFRIALPDGQIRWLTNLGQAEFDRSGQPLRMIEPCKILRNASGPRRRCSAFPESCEQRSIRRPPA